MLDDFSNQAKQVSINKSELVKEIEERSKEYEEPPQNAKIDKVWKKTPGRNGIKVNIEKSLENMKDVGEFNKSLLVFEQVEPDIKLDDLPASPIYRGHPDKRMVTLLINVAWGTENIPSILNTLKKHKVKANFFIEGKWARNNTQLVKMIKEEGHLIGNHAFNHPDMKHLTKKENEEQIVKTNEILKAITGDTPKWFAPPSGSFTDEVVKTAAELEMETVLWSVDTVDWQKPTTSVMINRVMSKIHPGAMVLMHPTKVIEQGLDELILNIIQNEYKIGTIERLLSEKR
ncbi:polysaccharide deacetylase family protein [Aquibacillus halophilus]|uniref:Polysaccharide deacetylase family protein n=2 Tax=Aquibacillus halophilus TaxID=930132 RepID=A0A6A8DEN3_9BACI|nr:polysaccharide deacetylase family protein [Aquibacillus halophilus]